MKWLIVIGFSFALLFSGFDPVSGLLEAAVVHLGRCKCLKTTSSAFRTIQIKSIQVIPLGIRCRRTEIILTLRNNRNVCVDPEAVWVKKLIQKLTKSKPQ